MKIAYLHGLESNNQDPKNTWLRKIADDVYDPQIDYRQPRIYKTLLDEIREFDPDLIMGSSMGGYFTYKISRTLNVPAILFNPALHSRTVEPDMIGAEYESFHPKTLYVFGKNDDIISPEKTAQIADMKNAKTITLDHGHRTPYHVFQTTITQFIDNI